MTTYEIRFGHGHDTPGRIIRELQSDSLAVAYVRRLVADGYRNETWANVVLGDGRFYAADNVHGKARGRYFDGASSERRDGGER